MTPHHLRCETCKKCKANICSIIKEAKPEDISGIFYYTEINGCVSHSNAPVDKHYDVDMVAVFKDAVNTHRFPKGYR